MMDNFGYIGRPITLFHDEKKRVTRFEISKLERLMIDFSQKQHTLILSKSGGGKSYLAGVIIEELIRTMRNYCAVIFDPMGIFSTLDRPNNNLDEIDQWNAEIPNDIFPAPIEHVTRWIPAGDANKYDKSMYDKQFSMQARDFTYGILCYAFDMDLLDPQVNLYRKAQTYMLKEKGTYTLPELASFISCEGKNYGFQFQTVESLTCKLGALEELGIITNQAPAIHDFVREGEAVVFNLSLSSIYSARILVNFMAEKIHYLRKKITGMISDAEASGKQIELPSWYIPPVQFIVDEAHNYLTQKNPVLSNCIKEGRNSAMMVTAISQSPNLSHDIYANVTHIFVGPLTYYKDIATVQEMLPVEISKKDFSKQVRKLKKGMFMYYNTDDQSEKLVKIRPRRTHHPSRTELKDEKRFFTRPGIEKQYETSIPTIYYEDSPQLHESTFSTICRYQDGYQLDQVYPILDAGNALVLAKHTNKFGSIPPEFLMNLTNTHVFELAIEKLANYYGETIKENEEITVLRLRWVKD